MRRSWPLPRGLGATVLLSCAVIVASGCEKGSVPNVGSKWNCGHFNDPKGGIDKFADEGFVQELVNKTKAAQGNAGEKNAADAAIRQTITSRCNSSSSSYDPKFKPGDDAVDAANDAIDKARKAAAERSTRRQEPPPDQSQPQGPTEESPPAQGGTTGTTGSGTTGGGTTGTTGGGTTGTTGGGTTGDGTTGGP